MELCPHIVLESYKVLF